MAVGCILPDFARGGTWPKALCVRPSIVVVILKTQQFPLSITSTPEGRMIETLSLDGADHFFNEGMR
jgi:hypothetical protein